MIHEWTGDERRRFPRLKGATVEYFAIGKASPREMSFTEDISAVGIRILSSDELAIDTILLLKIYLPHCSGPVEAKGRVVWTRQSRFLRKEGQPGTHFDLGVEFVEISDEDQRKVCQYTLDQTIDPDSA